EHSFEVVAECRGYVAAGERHDPGHGIPRRRNSEALPDTARRHLFARPHHFYLNRPVVWKSRSAMPHSVARTAPWNKVVRIGLVATRQQLYNARRRQASLNRVWP